MVKSYLRFLFLGAVLLFLLGYFNNQRSDSSTEPSEPAGVEQQWQQCAFLTLVPAQDFTQPTPGQKHPGRNPGELQCRQEAHLTELTKNTFQESRRMAEDIFPDLTQRKGHLLHQCCSAEIPS